MEVILISIFSAIIIFMTIYVLIKAFHIAYQRKEISLRKFRALAASSILIGLLVASILPFGYQKIFDTILKPIM
ncbi:hypothetical protein [Gracilibacillus lacisalsi]|uniref:hypothetical protein n=1 Tax=Gracilibacillus lacisalsi TaxID=393087 RepID=UPI000367D6BD|nr:hypothetical protein [Gracilibacillus lacisalsi]